MSSDDDSRATWEYTSVTVQDTEMRYTGTKKMNELGAKGWELVSVTNYVQGLGSGCTAYFKRKLPERCPLSRTRTHEARRRPA